MGLHKTEANLGVAKRENDVILLEDDYTQHYDGFDPNNPASHIIFSLNQHAYMQQSILFASKVEQQFKHNAKRYSRGVKQAGFLVLWKTTMPAVLIETGFLTNSNDEKFLASSAGQTTVGDCVFKAFKEYKNEMEMNAGKVDENEIAQIENEMNKPTGSTAQTGSGSSTSSKYKNGIEYKVQFYASDTELNTTHSKFSSLKNENIQHVKESGVYKYRIGSYTTLEEAIKKQSLARKAGFKDAFVVAFSNGKRITVDEAKSLAGK
jgi:N-acetylmuramoyl-L-alanine amidase